MQCLRTASSQSPNFSRHGFYFKRNQDILKAELEESRVSAGVGLLVCIANRKIYAPLI